MAEQARRAGLKAATAGSLAEALARIGDKVWGVPPRILITGSLYVAGEVLAFDGAMPR